MNSLNCPTFPNGKHQHDIFNIYAAKEVLDRTCGKVTLNIAANTPDRPYHDIPTDQLLSLLAEAKDMGLMDKPKAKSAEIIDVTPAPEGTKKGSESEQEKQP